MDFALDFVCFVSMYIAGKQIKHNCNLAEPVFNMHEINSPSADCII